jgi:hypothetical protein
MINHLDLLCPYYLYKITNIHFLLFLQKKCRYKVKLIATFFIYTCKARLSVAANAASLNASV